MRIRRSRTPLPTCWSGHPAAAGLMAETDIRCGGRGSMRAKVLVFKTSKALTDFWRRGLGKYMDRGALGAVNALANHVESVPSGREWIECDPRYFCVIGLTQGNLSMEVITHESVHAGFAYAKRHAKDFWVEQGDDYAEEDVCYPAGRIAAAINRFLHDAALYQ